MKAGQVRRFLRDLGIRPSKQSGQTFLLDSEVAQAQVAAATVGPETRALEIGPGLGALTEQILARTKHLTAIEKDPRFVPFLQKKFPELDVRLQDALEGSLPTCEVCISNLPYVISSPLTFRLWTAGIPSLYLMVQSDFARRITARQGQPGYSRLSVKAEYLVKAKTLFPVPAESFYPVPKVDSAVVEMVRRPTPPFVVLDPAYFFGVVDAGFQHRRKRLENALALSTTQLNVAREDLHTTLAETGFSGKRAEELSARDFGVLADALRARSFKAETQITSGIAGEAWR